MEGSDYINASFIDVSFGILSQTAVIPFLSGIFWEKQCLYCFTRHVATARSYCFQLYCSCRRSNRADSGEVLADGVGISSHNYCHAHSLY